MHRARGAASLPFVGIGLGLLACAPSPPPPSSFVPSSPAPMPSAPTPPPPESLDGGRVYDASVRTAPTPHPEGARLTSAAGCSGPSASAPVAKAGVCLVRGARAHVFHVRTALEGGRFLELGVYGGDVTVTIPEVDDAPAHVSVHAPLAFEGTTAFELGNVSIALAAPYVASPLLRLAKRTPVQGIAVGDRMRARAPFGLDFAVGPLDLPCSSFVLDDQNRVDTPGEGDPRRAESHALVAVAGPELESDPRDPTKLAKGATHGRLHLSWSEPPLVRAAPGDADGVRLTSSFPSAIGGGSADVELVARRPGAFHVRARTKAGSVLDGWIKEGEVEVGGGGGRGEGIGLCGCGHAGFAAPDAVLIAAGARIHAAPGGTVWATVPAPTRALATRDAESGFRRILHVDHVSEGGDGCDSGALEHAWVPAAAVTSAPAPRR